MAETTGLIQKLNIFKSLACVWIGPTPTNTELLIVSRAGDTPNEGAFENSMLNAITTAMVHRREVVAVHADNDARITGLNLEPA